MGFLVAVVVLQTIGTLLLLVVTVGLARRLRAHSDLLAGLLDSNDKLLPVGAVVPVFSTTAIDGTPVDDVGLRGPAAIALMAVDCPHCRTNLPEFIAYVRGAGYRREQVLAVVSVRDTTDERAAAEMVEALSAAATVIREPTTGGVVTKAFAVEAYPSFYLVGAEGTLSAGAHAVRKLPNTARDDLRHSPVSAAAG